METPTLPDLETMPSWLLVCLMQLTFQVLLKRMGYIMSPTSFIEESSGGQPIEFGTHLDFGGDAQPWRDSGAISIGGSWNADPAGSGSAESAHPPPNRDGESSESEHPEDPLPKERPWKRRRL